MSFLDRYITEAALFKSKNSPMKKNVSDKVFADLIPRHQEIIRVCIDALEKISGYEPDDDYSLSADIIGKAINTIERVEEMSYHGLIDLGIEPIQTSEARDPNERYLIQETEEE